MKITNFTNHAFHIQITSGLRAGGRKSKGFNWSLKTHHMLLASVMFNFYNTEKFQLRINTKWGYHIYMKFRQLSDSHLPLNVTTPVHCFSSKGTTYIPTIKLLMELLILSQFLMIPSLSILQRTSQAFSTLFL